MLFFAIGAVLGLIFAVSVAPESWPGRFIAWGVGFLTGTLFAYLSTPTLAWGHIGIIFLSIVMMGFGRAIAHMIPGKREHMLGDATAGGIVVAAIVVMAATTHAFFYADDYRGLLNVQTQKEFNPSDVLLDQSKARVVDQQLAARAGNELLGNKLGMGSRYDIATPRIQKNGDELQWVATFEHKGFWRWWSNSTVPGYLTVNSSSYSDSQLVTNEDVEINYGLSGFYFSTYLPRHLYTHGYSTVRLSDYTLELDDEGKPHWVVSIVEPQVGFSGYITTGVLVVDAKTGEIREESVSDAPEWVERVQPDWVINDQISSWGRYIDGWLNYVFIGDQVIESTRGSVLVYTKDGRAAWYTGAQSSGDSGQGTMGFFLTDSRTGETTFYRRAGITEEAARSTIEGLVQEFGYNATTPIPYNINGESTFISVLKDKQGNPQQIGMVSYNDRSIAAVGKSLDEATRQYVAQLEDAKNAINLEQGQEPIAVTGVIRRMRHQNVGGTPTLFFSLDDADPKRAAGKLFALATDSATGSVLTQPGDQVRFEVRQLEDAQLTARSFENENLKIDSDR